MTLIGKDAFDYNPEAKKLIVESVLAKILMTAEARIESLRKTNETKRYIESRNLSYTVWI